MAGGGGGVRWVVPVQFKFVKNTSSNPMYYFLIYRKDALQCSIQHTVRYVCVWGGICRSVAVV